jgi:anti-anti-sigma regulatory factor
MTAEFKLRQLEDFLVIDAKSSKFCVEDFDFLLNKIKKCKISKKILINMNNIDYFDNEFADYFTALASKNDAWDLCFYNLNPIINLLFYMFNLDKYFEIYISEQDSICKKKPLVKRRLKLVS